MRTRWITLTALMLLASGAWGQPSEQQPSELPSEQQPSELPNDLVEAPPAFDSEFGYLRYGVDMGPVAWLSSEYLMWWMKSGPMPVPVATSAPSTSTAPIPTALGNADTSVVLGGQDLGQPVHSGGRFTAGLWLSPEQIIGLEGNYLFLANRSTQQFAGSTAAAATPFLGNPFFDVSPGTNFETANFLASPGVFAGAAVLMNTSRLQGAECNCLLGLLRAPGLRFDLLGGFRYLELDEGLVLATTQTDPLVTAFPGQFVNTLDSFDTRNNFYGGQLGGRLDLTRGRFFLQTSGKVALGSTHETVRIKGFSTTNTGPGFVTPIATTTVPGGIYAQPTNIGESSRERFAVAPEVSLQVGIELAQRLRAFVGYNFLYVSEVARPGDQIDRLINSTQLVSFTGVPTGPLVGTVRPIPLFNSSDFWAQGIIFGMSLLW